MNPCDEVTEQMTVVESKEELADRKKGVIGRIIRKESPGKLGNFILKNTINWRFQECEELRMHLVCA